jgi:hypothetical protein
MEFNITSTPAPWIRIDPRTGYILFYLGVALVASTALTAVFLMLPDCTNGCCCRIGGLRLMWSREDRANVERRTRDIERGTDSNSVELSSRSDEETNSSSSSSGERRKRKKKKKKKEKKKLIERDSGRSDEKDTGVGD